MNESNIWECQTAVRWLIREEPKYHNHKIVGSQEVQVLQQAWKDVVTGKIIWKDVPVIEEPGFEEIKEENE